MEPRLAADLYALRQSCQDAMDFVEGVSHEQFLTDRLLQHAVTMALINIGAAAGRIADRSPIYAASQPVVEWRKIRDMRNRIAHGYNELDFDMVWKAAKEDVPELLEAVGKE